jgi:uncharacterized membrane protein
MVWLQSVLLYLHIIGAIFWFGSGLFLQFVITPALISMPFEDFCLRSPRATARSLVRSAG